MAKKKDKSNQLKHADKDPEIISKTVTAVNTWYNAFGSNIDHYNKDYSFIHLDQWTSDLRSARSIKKKNILTINYLQSYCAQLIGEELKNDPDISVRPNPNILNSSKSQATLIEGLIRKIFVDNDFTSVKNQAFSQGVYGGFSSIWVDFEYENPESFYKKIKLFTLNNPTAAFFDPLATDVCKQNGDFCGYFKTFAKDNFYQVFPDTKSDLSFKNIGYLNSATEKTWGDAKTVNVAYIWKKEYYTDTIVRLSNGESMPKKDAEELIAQQEKLVKQLKKQADMGMMIPPELMQSIKIEAERISTDCYKIYFYKMIADEVLYKKEWPSKILPGIFVDHNSVWWNGSQYTKSFHRNAQDTQRYLNYVASQSADALMNMHNGTWLANPEQVTGEILDMWLHPQNDKGILLANKDDQGQMPTYTPPPNISPAFDSQYQRAVLDIQNVLGRFDAGRGQQDNAVSGKAINYRAMFGNLGSIIPFQFLENAILAVSKTVLSLIPAVYDTMRIIGVRPKHGDDKQVKINYNSPTGVLNDMSKMHYNIMLDNGMSFAAQKAASIDQLKEIIQSNPMLSPLLSDLIAENLDLPNANQIIQRIRLFLLGIPIPQIISQETGMQAPPPPPNPVAQLEMQKMQNETQKTQNEGLKIAMSHQNQQAQHQLEMMNIQNKAKEIENNSIENQLKSQALMNDAVSDHGKTVASLKESNAKIIDAQIRAAAELEKAAREEKHREF